ncbi:unnamed protein product [Peniophora sp. CBMAI 1063]|nr:unnamed protein product [Peniophora sp. CBMAI 1063]
MADQETYAVEYVIAAQAHVVGRRLKWKYRVKWEGYDADQNSWEPEGNINSSGDDDDVLKLFWKKIDTDGRDREDMSAWEAKEIVWLDDNVAMEDPEYPKLRKNARPGRTPRKRTLSAKGAALRHAEPSSPSASPGPSTSKRKRASAEDAEYTSSPVSPKRQRPPTRTTRSEKAVKQILDIGRTSSPSVPDSEEDILIIGHKEAKDNAMAIDEPSSSRSTRRQKASTKRFEEPELVESVKNSGTLATKASAVNGSASKSKAKPAKAKAKSKSKVGPGRSAKGVDPLLLENVDDALEVADEIGVGKDATVNIPDTATTVSTPPEQPSKEKIVEELKEMAKGVSGGDEELAEYDETQGGKDPSVATDADVAMTQATEVSNSARTAVLFPTSTQKDAKPAASGSMWGNISRTMFTFGSANGKSPFGGLASSFSGLSTSASTDFMLSVSPSLHIPASFKDIRATSSVFSGLGAPTISGKLYGREATDLLLGTLEPAGAFARVILDAKASPREEAAFAQLYQRLEGDSMLVAVYGADTLAFCAVQSASVCGKLKIPTSLRDFANTILAAHVRVQNVSAYADAAVKAENVAW